MSQLQISSSEKRIEGTENAKRRTELEQDGDDNDHHDDALACGAMVVRTRVVELSKFFWVHNAFSWSDRYPVQVSQKYPMVYNI